MEIIKMSNKKFNELEPLSLSNNVYNTEAELYFYQDKNKWQNEKKVLKKLFLDEGNIFSNKLYTINSLIDNRSVINMEELAIPEKLAVVSSKVVGYTMPYVEGTNLADVIFDKNVSHKEKIEYFKQVGEILEKIKNIRKHTDIDDFYLNDLHESNLIINKETNKINIVDMDSCRINGNKPFATRYLSGQGLRKLPNKYHVNEDNKYLGYIIANEDTDLYCYNIMVLNYLFKGSVNRLTEEEFYTYLQYLERIGIPNELVYCFSKLYLYMDNVNIKDYLDMIDETSMYLANKKVFENYHNKKIYYKSR